MTLLQALNGIISVGLYNYGDLRTLVLRCGALECIDRVLEQTGEHPYISPLACKASIALSDNDNVVNWPVEMFNGLLEHVADFDANLENLS